MLRYTSLLLTASIVTLCSIILVKMINAYLARNTSTPANPAGYFQDSAVDHLEDREDPRPSKSVATIPNVIPTPPPIDGRSLMDSYCTQCHLAKWLDKIEKPGSDWEKTLERMEMMGVQLDDDEKVILIDYLSVEAVP